MIFLRPSFYHLPCMKPKLFLLKADFLDDRAGEQGQRYYCPYCVFVEGILSYYPQLNNELEIQRLSFDRPRRPLVAVLGEDHQFCPSLVLSKADITGGDPEGFQSTEEYFFTNDEKEIARYLANRYGIALPHP